MNWTAILALLAVAVLQYAMGRALVRELRAARNDTKDAIKRAEHAESMKSAANAQAYENRLEADRWKKLHDSLLKRQSRPSGPRTGETEA